jgi:RNA polymerase sigma-70 factor, ECF subfamily
LKIAIRQTLARRRENARFEDLDDIPESASPRVDPRSSPEQIAVRNEIREVLQRAIDELPPTLRTVLMLRQIEGMNASEAAEVLDISEDNLNVRLHRAKIALREKLIEKTGEQGPNLFMFEAPRCERLIRQIFESLPLPAR